MCQAMDYPCGGNAIDPSTNSHKTKSKRDFFFYQTIIYPGFPRSCLDREAPTLIEFYVIYNRGLSEAFLKKRVQPSLLIQLTLFKDKITSRARQQSYRGSRFQTVKSEHNCGSLPVTDLCTLADPLLPEDEVMEEVLTDVAAASAQLARCRNTEKFTIFSV